MDNKVKGEFYHSAVSEDIILCIGTSFFTAAFNWDCYISDKIMSVVRIVALIIMLVCWWSLSFFNGLRMRKSFAAAACCFHMLLPLIYAAVSHIYILKFSDAGLLFSEAAVVFTKYPYKELEEATGFNGMYFSAFMAVLCLLLYSAGYVYTKIIVLGDSEETE